MTERTGSASPCPSTTASAWSSPTSSAWRPAPASSSPPTTSRRRATLHAIADERCTVIHGVPTMFAAELDHPDFPDRSTSRASAPGSWRARPARPSSCTASVRTWAAATSSSGTGRPRPRPSHAHAPRRRRRAPPPHRRAGPSSTRSARSSTPTPGRSLPIGEQGEVCIRGYNVMRGYYAQPDETARAIDDAGWLHTGDLGTMDPDGYIAITGRLKDMIIRGGENIYPAEIEAFYFEHPEIEQAPSSACPTRSWARRSGCGCARGTAPSSRPRNSASGRRARSRTSRSRHASGSSPSSR
jgi:fatty-acyl-CoA synthase